jgi:hypothetical protein
MKTKLIYLAIGIGIFCFTSCKGKTCYECDYPGEKSGSDSWSRMPNYQTMCQGEDESDEDFEKRVDVFRNSDYNCTKK